jgi:hypothetical protein
VDYSHHAAVLALAGHPCPEPDEREAEQQQRKKEKTMSALEIQTSDQIQMPWTAWFLYGDTGSGKTRVAATFPAPLFLVPANENSHLTLAQLLGQKLPYILVGKRADGTVVGVRAHYSEILTELEKRHEQMRREYTAATKARAAGDEEKAQTHEAAAAQAFPWQTIVPESLTHLGDLLVDDVGDFGRKKMDQQAWGVISTFLRTVHSRLRNMDVHVVYTSLAKQQLGENGSVISGGPNIIGSLAEKLPSACDVIAYLEEIPGSGRDKNGKLNPSTFRTYFRKYQKWQVRSRFGGFPDYVDNFQFAQVEAKLSGATAPAETLESAPG